jgi:hypothetical protein
VRIIAQKLSGLYRCFLREWLPVPRAATYSEILAALCRLLGCAAIVGIVVVSVRNAQDITAQQRVAFALLVSVVAITVGNLVKEVAVLMCSIAVNGLGLDFRSTRLTLDGTAIDEVVRPDGTWDRYLHDERGVVHEWREADGHCRRETLRGGSPRTREGAW